MKSHNPDVTSAWSWPCGAKHYLKIQIMDWRFEISKLFLKLQLSYVCNTGSVLPMKYSAVLYVWSAVV